MALLLVKVPVAETLPLNEFFDYDGVCYASAAGRSSGTASEMELEDFYEATVRTQSLPEVPVFFVIPREEAFVLAGWYKKAEISRRSQMVSLFMEGNIRADAADAVCLPESLRKDEITCHFGKKLYEVVESYDERYEQLLTLMVSYRGANAMLRCRDVDIHMSPEVKRDPAMLRRTCEVLAEDLMSDHCRDIGEIRKMELYAERLTLADRNSADGYYYLAMACHHLGHVRQGMKAIEKAIRMEGEAGDLLAMKANLMVSMKHVPEAAALYHRAWLADADEDYLIQEGRCYLMEGKMDQAYSVLKQVTDKDVLTAAGINLRDIERRWPFINVRGLGFRHIFGRKQEKI